MTDLEDLARRVEAADGAEQARLIEEAFWAISPNYADPRTLRAMLDAEAFESAAISLVPAGHSWRKYTDDAAAVYGGSLYGGKAQVRYDGFSSVFSLALCAAVLRLTLAPILKAESAALRSRAASIRKEQDDG